MIGTLILISITQFWGTALEEHKTKIRSQWFESSIKLFLTPLTPEPDPLAMSSPLYEHGMKLNGNKTKLTAGVTTRLQNKGNLEG